MKIARHASREFDGRAAQATRDMPIVRRIRHLYLTRVGQNWIDADHERRAGLLAKLFVLGEVLAEAVKWLRGK